MADDAAARTAALLASLWQKNLPLLRGRLELLERAADALGSGSLSEGLRQEALGTAHKLAGSLGMFGFPEGTTAARQMEQALGDDPMPDPQLFAELNRKLRTTLQIEL